MLDDTFRRSGRLLLDHDGDLWSVCPLSGDRDYLGRIDDGLTTYSVEPEELPIVEVFKADWMDASRDLRGEVRGHYYGSRL